MVRFATSCCICPGVYWQTKKYKTRRQKEKILKFLFLCGSMLILFSYEQLFLHLSFYFKNGLCILGGEGGELRQHRRRWLTCYFFSWSKRTLIASTIACGPVWELPSSVNVEVGCYFISSLCLFSVLFDNILRTENN